MAWVMRPSRDHGIVKCGTMLQADRARYKMRSLHPSMLTHLAACRASGDISGAHLRRQLRPTPKAYPLPAWRSFLQHRSIATKSYSSRTQRQRELDASNGNHDVEVIGGSSCNSIPGTRLLESKQQSPEQRSLEREELPVLTCTPII